MVSFKEDPGVPWEDTPDGRHYRRYVTDKWGEISFALTVILVVVAIIGNTFVSPAFYTIVNEKPSSLRTRTLNKNWTRIGLWFLTTLLVVAVFAQTNHFSAVFIAKRLGRLVVALMPCMYLLTLKPSPLPRSFYLQLIPVHKFLSRVVVIFAVLHGVVYTYVYYENGSLSKLQKMANVLGIVALFVFVAMAVTGIAGARRAAYELFYEIHVVGSWICLPMIRWHSRPRCDGYLMMMVALLVYQMAMRLRISTNVRLRVQFVSPTLLLIQIPKSQLPASRWWSWSVASHIRLGGPLKNPLNWIRSTHPYTIASLPDDDALKLVIRPGDYTIKMRQQYSLSGPHKCIPNYLLHQIQNSMMQRVLLIIGGAGIAFGAPVLRYLRIHGIEVRMVWVMRDPYDARVLPQLGLHEDVLRGDVEIYYTGESLVACSDDQILEDESLTIGMSDNCCDEEQGGVGTTKSAATQSGRASRRVRGDPVLSKYANFMFNSRPHLNLRLKSWLYGYSMDSTDCCCADRVIDACAEDRLGSWVMSCGGQQLSNIAREWAQTAGVCYFEDSFSL